MSSVTIRTNWLIPVLAAIGAVGVAVIGGLAVGPGANEAVGDVLSIQSASANWLTDLGTLLPFSFAFLAGMLATVNPCGFVMLPAYLTLYVGDESDSTETTLQGTATRGVKAVYVSLAMGLGFVALFGFAGLLVTASKEAVADALPWIGFVLGFVMAVLGAYILSGGKLYTGFAQRMADRVGDPRVTSLRGYFLFGVSYALASLSCTLPIFLSVVTSSFSNDGFIRGVIQFLSYAGGMTFLIMILTLAIALFKSALVNQLRRLLPYINAVSAGILIIVGAYLIFYWLTEGDLSRSFGIQ